jgi:hypothetical protein
MIETSVSDVESERELCRKTNAVVEERVVGWHE